MSGDVENTNASWLSRRLASVGLEVTLLAAVRDDIQEIAVFLRAETPTGRLRLRDGRSRRDAGRHHPGGRRCSLRSPVRGDRLASGRLAEPLRGQGSRRLRGTVGVPPVGCGADPEPARRRAGIRARKRLCLSGAPQRDDGDVRRSRRAFPGPARAAWRCRYRTGEGQIVSVLEKATRLHPAVEVGSYPRFLEDGPEVEVVLKSTDEAALADAARWLSEALGRQQITALD